MELYVDRLITSNSIGLQAASMLSQSGVHVDARKRMHGVFQNAKKINFKEKSL